MREIKTISRLARIYLVPKEQQEIVKMMTAAPEREKDERKKNLDLLNRISAEILRLCFVF